MMKFCGALQAAGGRRMTGHEAFSATVSAPDGAVSAVPVVLAEGGAHYQATLQWLQTGIHKVSACGACWRAPIMESPLCGGAPSRRSIQARPHSQRLAQPQADVHPRAQLWWLQDGLHHASVAVASLSSAIGPNPELA